MTPTLIDSILGILGFLLTAMATLASIYFTSVIKNLQKQIDDNKAQFAIALFELKEKLIKIDDEVQEIKGNYLKRFETVNKNISDGNSIILEKISALHIIVVTIKGQ